MTLARTLTAAALALATALPLAPARAETIRDGATYDVVMKGFTVASLTFDATETDGSYAVRGKLATAGLVAFLRKISYDASSNGSVSKGRYTPSRYVEKADTGKRVSEAVMDYRRGVPQLKVYNPPRDPSPQDVQPASQGGTVDPLTALYATMRDAAPGSECNRTLKMFDGKRASRLTLAEPQPTEGGGVTCAGEYRRVAGFTPEEMAEKSRFPFTLTYAPGPDGKMQVVEVAMDSLYGRARMVRR